MNLETFAEGNRFTTLDWCIVGAYLAGMLAVGLHARSSIANMGDFVLAGRALKSRAGVATLVGGEMALVAILFSAQEAFREGFKVFHIAVAAAVMTLAVGLTGFIVVPLRRMEVLTIPEFYRRRFGRGVQVLGGAILAVTGIVGMGMFLKMGSFFLMGLTGVTNDLYVRVFLAVLLAVVLAYTILGGMISVVINNCIQFIILSFGLVLACVVAVRLLEWEYIYEMVEVHKGGRSGFNPFAPKAWGLPYMAWTTLVAIFSCAVSQPAVLRACATEHVTTTKRIYRWASIGFLNRFLIPMFLGICAFVYANQDPAMKARFLQASPENREITLLAMPVFLGRILPAGIIGLITTGLMASFLAGYDSRLLSWSSVLTQDVVAPLLPRPPSAKARLTLTRVFILAIGLFLLAWWLWYPLERDLMDYLVTTGAIYFTGAFPLLFLGIYWRRASRAGAYAALVCGFAAAAGLRPVQSALGFQLGMEWVGLATVALCLLAMVIGSLLFPSPEAWNECVSPRAGAASPSAKPQAPAPPGKE